MRIVVRSETSWYASRSDVTTRQVPPRFSSAAAQASLAFAYISIPLSEGPSEPFIELGRRAALRALELDGTIAEAHAVKGRILAHFDLDAAASDREGQTALQLEPNNPSLKLFPPVRPGLRSGMRYRS